jgi:hypothetical protein
MTLVLYLFGSDTLQGDEGRYLQFAENIINGFYANKDLKPGFLWNGPGYPLVISPLVMLGAPLFILRMLNVVFILLGIYFIFRSFRFYFSIHKSLIVASICLVNPYHLHAITRILTEAQAFFLISLCLFSFIQYFCRGRKNALIPFFIASGMLVLTKAFFSYVFLALFVLGLARFLITKKTKFLTPIFPLLFCLPYLVYTYNITGKVFYWVDSGGSTLYAMASPYESEYGDWFPPYTDRIGLASKVSLTTNPKPGVFFEKHYVFLDSISDFSGIDKDSALKQKAIEYISEHPYKYIKNIMYNYGRIFFRTPFTTRELKPEMKLIFYPYGILNLILVLWVIANALRYRGDAVPFVMFALIYLGGIGLVSSESRFLYPIFSVFVFLFFMSSSSNKRLIF